MSPGIGVGVGLPFVHLQRGGGAALLDNAVAYWRAKDYSGSGQWLDGSGNGHHATFVGGVTFDTDKMVFDGVDGHFSVASSSDFTFGASDSYTVVAVINRNGAQANGARIVTREGLSGEWIFLLAFVGGDGLRLQHDDTSGNALDALGVNDSLASGTDITVAARVNRATETAAVLNDGVVQGSDADTSNVTGTTATGTVAVTIGGNLLYFKGSMKGVAIFRSALTDEETVTVGEELVA